jgi:hypothetical protein
MTVVRRSKVYTVDQRRILGRCLRAVHLPRYRPPLQQIVGRGLEQLNAGAAVQPRFEILFGQEDWHSIMYFGDKVVRLGDNHCAGFERFTGCPVAPFVP